MYALYYGPSGTRAMILSLAIKIIFLYAGATNGYSLDPYVVLPTTNGQARYFGYWVEPARAGGTGFIQPVQLAF